MTSLGDPLTIDCPVPENPDHDDTQHRAHRRSGLPIDICTFKQTTTVVVRHCCALNRDIVSKRRFETGKEFTYSTWLQCHRLLLPCLDYGLEIGADNLKQ